MSNSNRTPERAIAFCAALAETANIGRACRAIGMGRTTAYEWRESDPDFAAMWDKAMRVGVTALEDEAKRRAFEGIDKPLTHKGQFTYLRDPETGDVVRDDEGAPRVATVKEYSDTLAIVLLKAHDPERYRDNSKVEMAGSLQLTTLSDDELEEEIAALEAQIAHTKLPTHPAAPIEDDCSDLV